MTASLKLSWKVTSHPLVKEATKSLNASSKPKQIFNKKYSPERGTSTGTCSKAELGVDIKAWAGQSCCLKGQGLGGGICHGPALSHLSPHSATRPHYLSMLMEQKGRSTSKQKSLTWNSTSLLCSSSIPQDLSHGNLMKSCFSTQALLWVKKPAVTASESYLGMELKSCQIALWG